MSIDGALAALKAAEENQCGCLGDTLARAIEDLEVALMRPAGYVVVRSGHRPWVVGDQVDVIGPVNVERA